MSSNIAMLMAGAIAKMCSECRYDSRKRQSWYEQIKACPMVTCPLHMYRVSINSQAIADGLAPYLDYRRSLPDTSPGLLEGQRLSLEGLPVGQTEGGLSHA